MADQCDICRTECNTNYDDKMQDTDSMGYLRLLSKGERTVRQWLLCRKCWNTLFDIKLGSVMF